MVDEAGAVSRRVDIAVGMEMGARVIGADSRRRCTAERGDANERSSSETAERGVVGVWISFGRMMPILEDSICCTRSKTEERFDNLSCLAVGEFAFDVV